MFVDWVCKFQQTIASSPQDSILFRSNVIERSVELSISALHISVFLI